MCLIGLFNAERFSFFNKDHGLIKAAWKECRFAPFKPHAAIGSDSINIPGLLRLQLQEYNYRFLTIQAATSQKDNPILGSLFQIFRIGFTNVDILVGSGIRIGDQFGALRLKLEK
ncbi:MAG TPA: hypothetical protein VMW34_10230 [Anaerolineales bacterium]|nr:hypothetical protein [Anaerolineales bacterium]